MTLSHTTLVLPASFVDFIRSDVLRQISGLYDGKIALYGMQGNIHHLPVSVMENGQPAHDSSQHIVVHTIQYDRLAIDPEDKYSAAGVLAIADLEKGGNRIAALALRFRVFLYQEHKPNAYIKAL